MDRYGCSPCRMANCKNCDADFHKCTNCGTGYQMWNNICVPGPDAGCMGGQGLIAGTCFDCNVSRCEWCPGNVNVCWKCNYDNGYGADMPALSCDTCYNPDCAVCYFDLSKCSKCLTAGNGVHANYSCQPCTSVHPQCLKCHNNVYICEQCKPGYGLYLGGC